MGRRRCAPFPAPRKNSVSHPDVAACSRWLASAPPLDPRHIEILASHLTIGETYFFRDFRHFEVLAHHILPRSLTDHAGKTNGACASGAAARCTGEEAYSLAILLRRHIPLTSINGTSPSSPPISRPMPTSKAQAGIFGEWSFRDAPVWLKTQYFRPTGDGRYEIAPKSGGWCDSRALNLAGDSYPSLANDTQAMDVIFCRNVLMYFTPAQAAKAIHQLFQAQMEGGWLFVSAAESLHGMTSPYTAMPVQGAVLYQRLIGKPPHRAMDIPSEPLPFQLIFPPVPGAAQARRHKTIGPL